MKRVKPSALPFFVCSHKSLYYLCCKVAIVKGKVRVVECNKLCIGDVVGLQIRRLARQSIAKDKAAATVGMTVEINVKAQTGRVSAQVRHDG